MNGLPRKNAYPSTLSDQPLLGLDEGVGLGNRDVEQVGDSLRGCQGKPIKIRGQHAVRGSW